MNAVDTTRRKNKETKKEQFTREEDQLLLSLADKYHNNYRKIANHMEGRSHKQVRERLSLFKYLGLKATWDKDNDTLLRDKVLLYGTHWEKISKFFYPWPIEYIKAKWKSIQMKYSENGPDFIGIQSTFPMKEEPNAIEAVTQEGDFPAVEINSNTNVIPQNKKGIASFPLTPSSNNFMQQFIDVMNEGSGGKIFKANASKTKFTEVIFGIVNVNVPCSFCNSSGTYYDAIEILGKGSSCVTVKVKKKEEGSHESFYEAAKIIPKEYIKMTNCKDLIQKEIALLKILRKHSKLFNIIEYHDDFEILDEFGKEYVVVVTELFSNGDLLSVLADEELAKQINLEKTIIDIARAIQFLHHVGISHFDIKLENVLVGKKYKDNFCIKLCDFGFSIIGLSKTNSRAGTFLYQGPEFFQKGEIDPYKADIYSLGVLIYILIEKQYPFININDAELVIFQKRNGDYKLDPKNNLHKLIERCLNPDPTKRPTIDDIISFFN